MGESPNAIETSLYNTISIFEKLIIGILSFLNNTYRKRKKNRLTIIEVNINIQNLSSAVVD
jgi:hypothetical protein